MSHRFDGDAGAAAAPYHATWATVPVTKVLAQALSAVSIAHMAGPMRGHAASALIRWGDDAVRIKHVRDELFSAVEPLEAVGLWAPHGDGAAGDEVDDTRVVKRDAVGERGCDVSMRVRVHEMAPNVRLLSHAITPNAAVEVVSSEAIGTQAWRGAVLGGERLAAEAQGGIMGNGRDDILGQPMRPTHEITIDAIARFSCSAYLACARPSHEDVLAAHS